MERKGDARVGRRREDGMGKGGHAEGENCQTESKLRRVVSAAQCLAALEANNEVAGRGAQNNGVPKPFNTASVSLSHSPGKNKVLIFIRRHRVLIRLFPLIFVLAFKVARLRGFLTSCSAADGLRISDDREQ